MKMKRTLMMATLCAAAGFSMPVMAQVSSDTASNFARDRNVSVRERPRSDYEARGLPLGGFKAFPRVGVELVQDDNIFATARNEVDDTVWKVRPEIAINSEWSRHSLSGFARGVITRYSDNSTENTNDYIVGVSGKLDILRRSNVNGSYTYNYLTEPRSSPTAPGAAAEPTRYTLNVANLGGVHEMNRLRLSGRVAYSLYDYDDPPRRGGGVIFQQDRNRTMVVENLRAEYAVSPDTAVYVAAILNQRNYDLERPRAAFDRDSDGYEAAVGVNFDFSALMRGEVQVGYLAQSYQDPRFKDIEGFSARAAVDWFPTELTTLNATLSRSVEETISIASPGFLATSVGARVDHELLRNVLINAQASYSNDDYEQLDRTDKTVAAGLGATYLMNRSVGITAGYNFLERSSKGVNSNPGFTDNKVSIGITLQL
jgi:hypothetical protein